MWMQSIDFYSVAFAAMPEANKKIMLCIVPFVFQAAAATTAANETSYTCAQLQ